MMDVADDADDGDPAIVAPHGEPPPERILTGPERARHRLVDDDDLLRVGAIGVGEQSAGAQRRAERLEVAGRHHAILGRK